MIKSNQTCLNQIKNIKLNFLKQNKTNKNDQIISKTIQLNPKLSEWIKNDQSESKMIKLNQKWSN